MFSVEAKAAPAVVVLEVAMGGGLASPGIRAVHDVVVDESRRVEDFQRGGELKGWMVCGLRVGLPGEARDGSPPPEAKARSKTLASTKQRTGIINQRSEVGRNLGDLVSFVIKKVLQLGIDDVNEPH
jgi:hypothetical protein